jgi:hypothetical protein
MGHSQRFRLAQIIYPQAALPAAEAQLPAESLPAVFIIVDQHLPNTSPHSNRRLYPVAHFNQKSSPMATANLKAMLQNRHLSDRPGRHDGSSCVFRPNILFLYFTLDKWQLLPQRNGPST